jgi:hypothetical protein
VAAFYALGHSMGTDHVHFTCKGMIGNPFINCAVYTGSGMSPSEYCHALGVPSVCLSRCIVAANDCDLGLGDDDPSKPKEP